MHGRVGSEVAALVQPGPEGGIVGEVSRRYRHAARRIEPIWPLEPI